MKTKLLEELKSYFLITLGLTIFAFGFTAFLLPEKIVGGGVSGIGMLLYYATNIPVGIWYFLINIGLLVYGFKKLGKKFAINSLFGVLVNTALFMVMQPLFPKALVSDQFMASLIGATLGGIGLGIAFANGGNSGGTDIIALVISSNRNISPGRIILYLNVIIIASSYFLFHSVEKIVYGYVVMAVSSYALDLTIEGQKQSFQIVVFSKNNHRIAERISKEVGRGVTLWKGYGWYTKHEFDILMVVAHKYDRSRIMQIIKQEDSRAFVTISHVQAAFGENFEHIKV